MNKPRYKEFHNFVEPVIKHNKVELVVAHQDGQETTILLTYEELRVLADYLEQK